MDKRDILFDRSIASTPDVNDRPTDRVGGRIVRGKKDGDGRSGGEGNKSNYSVFEHFIRVLFPPVYPIFSMIVFILNIIFSVFSNPYPCRCARRTVYIYLFYSFSLSLEYFFFLLYFVIIIIYSHANLNGKSTEVNVRGMMRKVMTMLIVLGISIMMISMIITKKTTSPRNRTKTAAE